MNMKRIDYESARSEMKPGDVIALGGKGYFSELTKFITSSNISHVGVILQTTMLNDVSGRFFNQIVQTNMTFNYAGISTERLSDLLDNYDGDLWWLPLDDKLRENKFDQSQFFDFIFNQARQNMRYDIPQALKSSVDALDELDIGIYGARHTSDEFSKFLSSQLIAAAFEKSGIIGSVNASAVAPIDLCRWEIYGNNYYQLKGDANNDIARYNSMSPSLWSV
jgi:hypothetical protein